MTDARLKKLVLTLTLTQSVAYHKTLGDIKQELQADPKHSYMLRDEHKLYTVERVLTNKPVSIADAIRSVTPNPYQS